MFVDGDAQAMSGDAQPALVNMNITGGDAFRVLSVPILRGRNFTEEEATTPNNSVLVSRSAADKLWPGENPLGRRIRPEIAEQDTLTFSVVGVVGDMTQNDWREAGEAVVYFPLTGPSATSWGRRVSGYVGSPAYVIKSSRAASLKREVRAIVHDVAPEAPVYREFTMEFLARRSMTLQNAGRRAESAHPRLTNARAAVL